MATRYTKDHEWIRLDGDIATVGITEHAQSAARRHRLRRAARDRPGGDEGRRGGGGRVVKAASDVYAPGDRRGGRGQSVARRRARHDQRGRRGQGLVLPAEALEPGRARRADDRGAVQGISHHARMRILQPWHTNIAQRCVDARRRDVHRPALQPRPCVELRRRHHGAGVVVAAQRAAALFGRRSGRSRGGVRRGAVELPHADLPLRGGEARLRRRFLRRRCGRRA